MVCFWCTFPEHLEEDLKMEVEMLFNPLHNVVNVTRPGRVPCGEFQIGGAAVTVDLLNHFLPLAPRTSGARMTTGLIVTSLTKTLHPG